MPRLSPVDQAFLLLETRDRPMNIGGLFVLAPPPGTRGDFAGRLLRTMLRRPVGPPFSYRLRPGPVKGLYSLVDDPHMDPAAQVRLHRLPRSTELRGLFAQVCRIHARPLPRSAPLWEQHVFTGLPGGRVALYFKTHHAMIDGVGFLNALNTMLTESRTERLPRALWEGLRHYKPPAAGGAQTHASSLLTLLDDARRTGIDMLRLFWHQGLRDVGLGRGLAAPFFTTPNVLKAAPSPHRVLAHCELPLEDVRAIAKRSGAKINDVLLTLIDMAMHRYIRERGAHVNRPLVADMPVALQDHGGTGNRITILQVPLGRPDVGPAERLGDVLRETAQVKREMRELNAGALTLYSIIQHSVASAIESLGLGELPMLANAVVSNPAGLEKRVYFNGAEVEMALPISVVAHHQVLNITITTYMDRLHVTFIALKEAIPDLQRLADCTAEAVGELATDLARAGRRGGAARPRKSAMRRTRKTPGRKSPRRAAVR
jgi:WS/DGAT/MGAT family acyltransferase